MDLTELTSIVTDLRHEGSDTADVEVKLAAGGFPTTVPPTLSAFGNTPGGGTLIFGLDEATDFASVGVYDVARCKTALASSARQAVQPPVMLDVWDLPFEGAAIVVARVHELTAQGKPCRVAATGRAYLRAYDGDYELSQVEEQAFLANRETPTFDRQILEGTDQGDLRPDLLDSYLTSCRSTSSALAELPDREILYRTGVTAGVQRQLTVAGLLALGVYPQQHVPNCVVQASVAPRQSDPVGTRASDARRFDGPIPTIMDEALRWVRRNTRTRVRYEPAGHVRDEPEFPVEAVRELLSNALIHRDFGPHALTAAITLKLDERQLVLSNPGGLWGITVERLGKVGVTSARNGHLLRICQNIRTREGNRVIEALATGIPAVLRSLSEAGMVPPRFHDQGIRFTVVMPNHALLAAEDLQWLAHLDVKTPLSDQQRHALVAMRHGDTWSNQSFREAFPMDSREARRQLAGLVEAGAAVAQGERGARVYRLASNLGEHMRKLASAGDAASGGDRRTADESPVRRKAPGARARNAVRIERALDSGPLTSTQLRAETGLTQRQLDYALADMRRKKRVRLRGGRGRVASYYELDEPSDSHDTTGNS